MAQRLESDAGLLHEPRGEAAATHGPECAADVDNRQHAIEMVKIPRPTRGPVSIEVCDMVGVGLPIESTRPVRNLRKVPSGISCPHILEVDNDRTGRSVEDVAGIEVTMNQVVGSRD